MGKTIARYSVYTLVITMLMFSLPLIAERSGAQGFKEDGLVEWAQLSMVIGMAVIFIMQSMAARQFRELFVVLACFFVFVVIRETDGFWDRMGLNWKYGYAFILGAGYFGYTNFRKVKEQIGDFLRLPAFPLLWAGFIIVIPFAQLVGNGDFLQAVLAEDYSRDYKRVIEEVSELMGYLLMFLGAVEVALETRTQAKEA